MNSTDTPTRPPVDSFVAWITGLPAALRSKFKRGMGTPGAFAKGCRAAAARLRFADTVDLSTAAADASHADRAAALIATIEQMDAQIVALNAAIEAGEQSMLDDVGWFRRMTTGALLPHESPVASTPFQEGLVTALQEGIAARIRMVGLPTSIFTPTSVS